MKVKLIRNVKDICAIKRLLANSPRNYVLFVISINTNLRASNILSFTIGQVRNLRHGDEVILKEKKTGKERRITVNAEVLDAVKHLLNSRSEPAHIDRQHSAIHRPKREEASVPTLSRIISGWCNTINLKGNYGSHSMRKTLWLSSTS